MIPGNQLIKRRVAPLYLKLFQPLHANPRWEQSGGEDKSTCVLVSFMNDI